jgi:hypothetical protein
VTGGEGRRGEEEEAAALMEVRRVAARAVGGEGEREAEGAEREEGAEGEGEEGGEGRGAAGRVTSCGVV